MPGQKRFRPTRRGVLAMALAGGAVAATRRIARAAPVALANPDPSAMKPGAFEWLGEPGPKGSVVIVASIPRQLVHVYRKGVLVGVSTCSTGKPGHSTPAGLFTVINKMKDHVSGTYGDPMPNTLRLTRKGVALHGGELPGYPASHGCVRLPLAFADGLFELTELGAPVVIGGLPNHLLVGGPGIVPAGTAGKVLRARNAARSLVPLGAEADTAILVSTADRRIYAVQDGTIVAQGPLTMEDPLEPLGTNVFVWRGGEVTDAESIWTGGGFKPVLTVSAAAKADPVSRIEGNAKVMRTVALLMHPGTALLTTDSPLNPGRTGQPKRRRVASHRRRRRHASR